MINMQSKRIKAILSLLDACDNIIDIGCDHAYVAILMAYHGSKKILATDIHKGALEIAKDNIKKEGLESNKPTVLAFGGSQGAKKINDAIVEIIKNKQHESYQMIWATGPKQYDAIKEELKVSGFDIEKLNNIKAIPYIYNMEELMNSVDVIVSRSGAMTITEISNLGKPSILIPLPNVSHNHQLYNAKVLENVGAAKIILNDELNGKTLAEAIETITKSEDIIARMGKNALKVSTSDVENKIYNEIKKLIK